MTEEKSPRSITPENTEAVSSVRAFSFPINRRVNSYDSEASKSVETNTLDTPEARIKYLRSSLNKITDRTLEVLSEKLLRVHILENYESDTSEESDKERILPILQTFIANVCVFERNEEAMLLYVKTFCKLRTKWEGRQGNVLMQGMLIELSKFFTEYSSLGSSEPLDPEEMSRYRNKCFKLCRFLSLLYENEAIGIRPILAILQNFCKSKDSGSNNLKLSLEVFCKLFTYCHTRLLKDPAFKEKVLPKYKDHLHKMMEFYEKDYQYKFMCLDLLDKL